MAVKTCKFDGCQRPVFSHLYCAYHQFVRKRKGGDLYQKKKKDPELFFAPKPIPKESRKRKKDNKRYRERLEERWQKSVEEKSNFCFFCGKVMHKREDNHHCSGRDVTILNEEEWVWSHRQCHTDYHSCTIEQLTELGWWNDYLARIREKDISTYYKEMRKMEKAKKDLEDSEI